MAPAGPARAVRARTGAEPGRRASTGRPSASGFATTSSERSTSSGIRPTSRSRHSSTPPTGRARASPTAHRSDSSHTFLQTGPFRPSNIERRVPGLVFVGSSTVPGVGVPMVHRERRARGPAGRGDGATGESALDRSYARCRRLTHRHGTTYYWATALLPRERRPHVWALYAFARHADDIVDDARRSPCVAERAAGTHGSGAAILRRPRRAAAPTTRCSPPSSTRSVRSRIDPECFERFLRSMAMDLTVTGYDTWHDLLDYMDGSAAVIGEMMLPVLEPTSRRGARAGTRPGPGVPAHELPARRRRGSRTRPHLPARRGSRALRRRPDAATRRRRLARPDALRDRTQSRALRRADAGHADVARRRTPMRAHRTSPVLPRSSIASRTADYDVFSRRARVPTWRKLATVGGAMQPLDLIGAARHA